MREKLGQTEILNLLSSNTRMTARQISEIIGTNMPNTCRALARLELWGEVDSEFDLRNIKIYYKKARGKK